MRSRLLQSRSSVASVAVAATVALVVALAGGARAASPLSPAQKQQMREHYDKATRAYDVQRFAEAVQEYQKVYEIGGDVAMLFNVAQAYRLNGQLEDAVFYYRRYLERSPNAPNRADVEKKIGDLDKTIAAARQSSSAAGGTPPRESAAPPPLVPVSPQEAVPSPVVATPPPVAPSSPAAPPPTQTAPATDATASPIPGPASTAPAPYFPPPKVIILPEDHRSNAKRTGAIVLLSVGAVGLVTAAVTGKLAQNKGDNLTYESMIKGTFDPELQKSGKTLDNIAVVSVIVGGGALVAGTVLLLLSRHPDGDDQAGRAVAAPSSRAAIAPFWLRDAAGLSAAMSF
jgi:hypothetical protein